MVSSKIDLEGTGPISRHVLLRLYQLSKHRPVCAFPTHLSKCTARNSQQRARISEFYNLSIIQNQDAVVIHDSLQSMCDSYNNRIR